MVQQLTGHDPRCERSATSPKRCRCQCAGAKHGARVHSVDTRKTRTTLNSNVDLKLLYPELGDDLKRAGQQLAAWRDAELAEGVPL